MKKKVMFRIISMQMGGVPKVLIDVIKNLDKEKFEPLVLMDLYQGELREEIPEGVKFISLLNGREEMSSCKPILLLQLLIRNIRLKLYKIFPSLIKRKIKIIPDIEVAIMHSSLQSLVNSPFKNSKKISWFHTDVRWHHSKNFGLKIAALMQRCDVTIFGSLHTKMTFEDYLEVKIPGSIYIHNTFDGTGVLEKSSENISDITNLFPPEEKSFVSVGRLVYQKGYDILIEAHAELLKEGFMHRIVIIEGGIDYNLLKEKIKEFGVQKSFILIGNKNNPYPYIQAANYYIQPSRYESYSIVLGETLILAKPIICTDAGGVTELLDHGKTAYIINFNKIEIKEAMKNFLNNPALVDAIHQRQKYFNFTDYNQKIYKQINNLMLEL